MKRRLTLLGTCVLALVTLSPLVTPSQASAQAEDGIEGTFVFAAGEANAHEWTPGYSLAWVQHAFDVFEAPSGADSAWAYYMTLGKPNDGAKPEDVPRGALAFFSGSGGNGHVGIALGDGQMISDLNIPGIKTGVYQGPLSEGGTLAGWALPPSDWPGRPELAGSSNDQGVTNPIPQNLAKPSTVKPPAAKPLAAEPPAAKPVVPKAAAAEPTAAKSAATEATAQRRAATTSTRTTPLRTVPPPRMTSTRLDVYPAPKGVAGVPADTPEGVTARLTARVAPGRADGYVQFRDNGASIGNPVNVSRGTASISTKLSAGSHPLSAVFTPVYTTAFSASTSPTITYVVVEAAEPPVTSTEPPVTSTAPAVTEASPLAANTDETLKAVQPPAVQPPVRQPPVRQPPVRQRRDKQAPVEQPPVEQAPIVQTREQQAPAEQAPADQVPADQPPADQPPAPPFNVPGRHSRR